MSYWILKCNPKMYRLEDRLADPNNIITWSVRRYFREIDAGDVGFIYTAGKPAERAIRAVVRIDNSPEMRPEIESEQAFWAARDEKVVRRFQATFVERAVFIPTAELVQQSTLKNLSILTTRMHQSTIFRVTAEEGKALLAMIGGN